MTTPAKFYDAVSSRDAERIREARDGYVFAMPIEPDSRIRRALRLGRRHQRPLPGLRRPRVCPYPTIEQQTKAVLSQFGRPPKDFPFGSIPWLKFEADPCPS